MFRGKKLESLEERFQASACKIIKQNKNTIILQEHEAFDKKILEMNQDCIELIEKISCYNTYKSRAVLQSLSHDLACFYQEESAHMSIRLMQMTAWFLLWRAERDKDMEPEIIFKERQKISLAVQSKHASSPLWQELPLEFRNFVLHSCALESRLRRVALTFTRKTLEGKSIVLDHQNQIREAFGAVEQL